jgi:hypothetical protein
LLEHIRSMYSPRCSNTSDQCIILRDHVHSCLLTTSYVVMASKKKLYRHIIR